MNKPKIFISHATQDSDWVRSFAQALKRRGVNVWFDEFDVGPGEDMADALESALRNSDLLVALMDSGQRSTPELYFELGAAIGMGKKFVPIVPKGLDPTSLPFGSRMRWYLVRHSPEETAEELSNTLVAA